MSASSARARPSRSRTLKVTKPAGGSRCEAFNDNLSFDEFITWQLAGDLLPNPTDDQILATAFNRLHQQEAKGGSVEYVADRVQTFSTAFLGLTFECARCHDHKFDPITHKDYYQLFSLFQNIDEAGLYSYFTESPPTPAHALADAPAKQRLAALQQAAAEAEKELTLLRDAKRDAFVAWLPSRPAEVKLHGELGEFGFEWLDKDTLANWIDPAQPAMRKATCPAMIEQGFLRCLSRPPDAREREITTQLYKEQLAYFQARPAEAAELLKTGNTTVGQGVSEPEMAAATVLAQALLNHDARVVKRCTTDGH